VKSGLSANISESVAVEKKRSIRRQHQPANGENIIENISI
jgi:hypothetical protein